MQIQTCSVVFIIENICNVRQILTLTLLHVPVRPQLHGHTGFKCLDDANTLQQARSTLSRREQTHHVNITPDRNVET